MSLAVGGSRGLRKIAADLTRGYISISGFCDPAAPMQWHATVNSQPSDPLGHGRAATLFTGGRASLSVLASGFSPATGEFSSAVAEGVVTLRGAH